MRQFLDIKAGHADAILFFRMGDFYEMFFEDAVLAAKKLDLTLTSRDKGREDAIPMCGVPHHAGRGYIARLTEMGHKVALCEQVEDPKKAKGLVKREVVRIITPGVVLDDEVLDPKRGRYLAAVSLSSSRGKDGFGLAYIDVSTGEFRATEAPTLSELIGELARVQASEVLVDASALAEGGKLAELPRRVQAAYTPIEACDAKAAAAVLDASIVEDAKAALEALCSGGTLAVRAAGDVVAYARETQPAGNLPLSRLQVYDAGEAVVLDEAAVANLELCSTLMGGRKEGSLLSVIDDTCTAPGGRALRRWLLYPLSRLAPIRRRHDAVEYLVAGAGLRTRARELLVGMADLERLAGRVSLGVATPRDLGKLRDSLVILPELARVLAGEGEPATLERPALLDIADDDLDRMARLERELAVALVDEPPAQTKDGGYIRDGFCDQVDEHRRLATGGKDEVLAIEARERERSGIGNLRVKYNRVFGYYIEVGRAHLSRVPDEYVRKQTVANGERYVTGELAELESKILSAQEALVAREAELLLRLCEVVVTDTSSIIQMGAQVAVIDACASMAEIAHERGFVRPEVDDGERLEIIGGRHPVVERAVPTGTFVPNDCVTDPAAEQILLITGPNMAGKSTYMRQVAQITLLAQMGCFVPAQSARIGLVDRIFTRVGASDNLARGESTFMVEMRETSSILAGATRKSLVILDEVGRGTSTYDGVSIAWAVTEFLHDAIGCRTLFATHYHELCALSASRPRIVNLSVAVREHRGEIIFLRQVVAGGSSRSYGIDVARLAGLPRSVVGRARQILAELERARDLGQGAQLGLFAAAQRAPGQDEGADEAALAIAAQLRGIDPNCTTPIEALTLLAELCAKVR